jgi:hypothetical protein
MVVHRVCHPERFGSSICPVWLLSGYLVASQRITFPRRFLTLPAVFEERVSDIRLRELGLRSSKSHEVVVVAVFVLFVAANTTCRRAVAFFEIVHCDDFNWNWQSSRYTQYFFSGGDYPF